jgi:hypothetical protein
MLKTESTEIKVVRFPVGGGIDVSYTTEVSAGQDETMKISRGFATPEDIEFYDVLDGLKAHIARDNYLLGVGLFGKEIDELGEADREMLDELYLKMNVDKIIVSGRNNNIVKITARIDGMYGNVKVMQAGPFNLRGANAYQYSEDLVAVLAELKTQLVIFLNKAEFSITKDKEK